ncbi:uroporphyrinogen-III synthase isoform X1 [Monomorium pharaonis]|uniref:uroporphyrinogen-III synthase isoform X1 n=1 Tax=Monomorium pharaonis TaxID=307658 RepID=UPI00063F5FFD|nr:uroporphyrinogen-III synthase isoform X1 [Monomorium pharaonis]XP_012533672.1 uroporphyrinogen-III synthase isoform X1 [Monomorium pharaonis]
MAGSNKTVVLCKGLSEKNDRQEKYIEMLALAGYSCECLQTLRFEFVNISELRAYLSVADRYSGKYYIISTIIKCVCHRFLLIAGLILTSPRTVEAVTLAVKEDTSILRHWKQMPAYCVGSATDSLARSQLNLQNCIGSQTGNSKQLAEKIVLDVKRDSKPLLYPCSEIARETIQSIVEDSGISIEKIVVYRTLESETLEQELPKILAKSSPSILVFFSPSTVEYITVQLKRSFYSVKDIKAVAIGPVTRDALINSGFNVYATADKPEPVALMRAITAAEFVENLNKSIS